MYGFPTDLHLKDIIGAELVQIRLGLCDVQFSFTSEHLFLAEGLIEVLQANRLTAYWNEKTRWSDLSFQNLLNAEVEAYEVLSTHVLELRFKGDLALRFHDDSAQYECLQIHPEGIII